MITRDYIMALLLTLCCVLSVFSIREQHMRDQNSASQINALNQKIDGIGDKVDKINPVAEVEFTEGFLKIMYTLAIEHKSQADYIDGFNRIAEEKFRFSEKQARWER